ncbi:MAG: T9SS type A sorting domain-containing protein, partial [Flavobacteriales bacterium]|nr:T9SS type A sorting domain-containing protein [Flavobacteriales bacterium]
MIKSIILSFVFFAITLGSYSQSTYTVTTTGTTVPMDAAINYTTNIWAQYLNSSVPIKLNVVYTDLTAGGPLAVTFPNGIKDFSGASITGAWYATCLANAITGTELNPGEFDMDIYVNSAIDYYFGIDGNPGINQYDFVSIFLHEMSHGLGTGSISKIDAGVGSFGLLDSTSVAPFSTSFPFPDLNGLPSVWDTYLINGTGQQLADTLIFPNISTALGNELESNAIFFSGSNATAANGGSVPKIFAPTTYEDGSSLQHFDETTFPNSSGNSLLTPYFYNNEVEHNPGTLLKGALRDIGWNVNNVGISKSVIAPKVSVYPNPTTDQLNFNIEALMDGQFTLEVFDLAGRIIYRSIIQTNSHQVDVSSFADGV